MIPGELKYTKEHEWVRVEGAEAVVGITYHAQSELGDITFVDLPEIGAQVKQAEGFATIESVKAASDIYAPVSGEITAVNDGLNARPEAINKDPYGDGWICRVKMSSAGEASGLLDADAYKSFLGES